MHQLVELVRGKLAGKIGMQTKQQKKEIVKSLAKKIKDSKAVVFSDFKGLSVKDMNVIRKELRKEKIDFQVLKKTLLNLVLKDAGIEIDARRIEGQIAVAVSPNDEVGAAKIIAKMAKANGNLKIAGGLLGKEILSKGEVVALSKLPSRQDLLAKLARALNAPVSGFVNALVGNIRSFIQVLKVIGDNKV